VQSDFSFDLPHTVSSVNNSTAEISGAATAAAAAAAACEPATLCFIIGLLSLSSHIISFNMQARSLMLPEN
jgi:hypothetical protein